jgi:hypothetical protein
MAGTSRWGRALMLMGAIALAGGWVVVDAGPASARQSVPATGDGTGTVTADTIYSYTSGDHYYLELYLYGTVSGALNGEYEGYNVYVENLDTGQVTGHGYGTYRGTVGRCGWVDEHFTEQAIGVADPEFLGTGTLSGRSPILFELSAQINEESSTFSYQAAWVACSSQA